MPTIVALETSPESVFRDKAFKLHQHLNEKHASLIHTRNVDCVRKAYAFQKQLIDDKPVVGKRRTPCFDIQCYMLLMIVFMPGYATRSQEGQPEALLNLMYCLLREKRQRRNDFLSSVVKIFDFDLKKCDECKVILM